jgi:hypothetical protein
MLSLQRCRELIETEPLSDHQLEAVRDQLYALARAAAAAKRLHQQGEFDRVVTTLPDLERADIRPRRSRRVDGRLARGLAEPQAVIDHGR